MYKVNVLFKVGRQLLFERERPTGQNNTTSLCSMSLANTIRYCIHSGDLSVFEYLQLRTYVSTTGKSYVVALLNHLYV